MDNIDDVSQEASNLRFLRPMPLNSINLSAPHDHLDSIDRAHGDGYGVYGHQENDTYYNDGYYDNGKYDPELLRPGFYDPLTAPDITADFTKAATALKTGELVKDENFTLYESVGALEIMDPKMDSGHLKPGETLEDDYDVTQERTAEEVIGIMDQLLCHEMAWHMGSSLSQSLFTSHYIDKLLWPKPSFRFDRTPRYGPKTGLVNLVLRAFCVALIKTCDYVYRTCSGEQCHEEEDMVLSLYNRDLLSQADTFDVMEVLLEAARDVEFGPFRGYNAPSEEHKHALSTRLRLRMKLLQAVDTTDFATKRHAGAWQACMDYLPELKETSKLGRAVENSFSAKLQRKLDSTVPPRPIAQVDFNNAWEFLNRLCTCGRDASNILDYHGGSALQNFIWSFQSRSPEPPAYIRCLLQSLIFTDMKVLNSLSVKQALLDDFEEISMPANMIIDESNWLIEAPKDSRFQIAKLMDDFIQKAADLYMDTFRTLCMNRSRLRRMLCHSVKAWGRLQEQADNIDVALREHTEEKPMHTPNGLEHWVFPLLSWAYFHQGRLLCWLLQTGFELQIYTAPELGGMYWFLQYLSQSRVEHITRIRELSEVRREKFTSLTETDNATLYRSLSFLEFSELEANATKNFANGLSSLYSFLSHIKLLPGPYPASAYGNPELQYALRMEPFRGISYLDVPSYDEFVAKITLRPDPNASQPKLLAQASSLLRSAEWSFKAAKKDWAAVSKTKSDVARVRGCEKWWRAGVESVLRSAVMAGLGVVAAKTAMEGAKSLEEVRGKLRLGGEGLRGKYHAWWVVPEVEKVV